MERERRKVEPKLMPFPHRSLGMGSVETVLGPLREKQPSENRLRGALVETKHQNGKRDENRIESDEGPALLEDRNAPIQMRKHSDDKELEREVEEVG
jgi:hypothetical protein